MENFSSKNSDLPLTLTNNSKVIQGSDSTYIYLSKNIREFIKKSWNTYINSFYSAWGNRRNITELLGTFIIIGVIIGTKEHPNAPLFIALTLTGIILLGDYYGNGHYNPVVTFLRLLEGKIGFIDFLTIILFQLFGGVLAYFVIQILKLIKYPTPTSGLETQ